MLHALRGMLFDQLKESVWEAIVPRERVTTLKSQMNLISSQMFDGQARVRVISKGQRPGEEFTQATPVLRIITSI